MYVKLHFEVFAILSLFIGRQLFQPAVAAADAAADAAQLRILETVAQQSLEQASKSGYQLQVERDAQNLEAPEVLGALLRLVVAVVHHGDKNVQQDDRRHAHVTDHHHLVHAHTRRVQRDLYPTNLS